MVQVLFRRGFGSVIECKPNEHLPTKDGQKMEAQPLREWARCSPFFIFLLLSQLHSELHWAGGKHARELRNTVDTKLPTDETWPVC